jgi:hypothetical protein
MPDLPSSFLPSPTIAIIRFSGLRVRILLPTPCQAVYDDGVAVEPRWLAAGVTG